jgi:ferric-dicitrate binding protein FerR (iron transport regulator)
MTMRPRLWWIGVLLLLASVVGVLLLRHFEGDGVVATLERAQGGVERDHAGTTGQFVAAALGSRFRVGDGIRTAHAATAALVLADGSKITLEQDTVVRFMATPPDADGRGIEIVAGRATLETGGSPLLLYTNVGSARLQPGTRIALAPRATGIDFSVQMGLARFETTSGTQTLEAGGEITIDIGGAILEAARYPATRARPPAEDQPPAKLSAVVDGAAVRVRGPEGGAWQPLPAGNAELAAGSTLQIPSSARVTLAFEGGSIALSGKGQFIVGAPGAAFVQTSGGSLFVDRGRTPVSLGVPGGSIIVRPASKAEAIVDAKRTLVRVGAGSADVIASNGRDTVFAGESATLLGSGKLDVAGRGPRYSDMVAAAGTSFVVHDPSPPTSVGFRLRDVCPTGGLIETLAPSGARVLSSARGDDLANILLDRGTHRYQARCLSREGVAPTASATGRVTILRDAGTGVLSRMPPVSRIDTDGRSYTVMYQNLLPQIVVRWPKAPEAASYTLTLSSKRGVSSTQAPRPTLTFDTGRLSEGTHVLTFSAEGRSSAPTKLSIVFDNAAPTARIQSPANGSFQLGSAVNVAGVAAPGWGVSVAGHELALDDQSRFSEQVTDSSDQQTLQLRFSHPQRGVHYYLRHAAGTAL